MIKDGIYHPNVPGARTIRDARPLYVGNERVSVHVDSGRVTLFHGLRIVHEGPMPRGVQCGNDLHRWAAEFKTETHKAIHTTTPSAPIVYRTPKMRRTAQQIFDMCGVAKPPVQRTPELQAQYNQYIADGLADTDGWFRPMDFDLWARTR